MNRRLDVVMEFFNKQHERAFMKVRRRCRNKRVSEFGMADARGAIKAERRATRVALHLIVRGNPLNPR